MEEKENLVGSLAHWLAAGKLEVRLVLPVIQNLAGAPQSLVTLLEQLDESCDPAATALASHVREILTKEALRLYEKRKAGQKVSEQEQALLGELTLGIPPEWTLEGDPIATVEAAVRLARDLAFLAANQEKAPQLFRHVKDETNRSLLIACSAIVPRIERHSPEIISQLEKSWPADLPGRGAVLAHIRNLIAGSQSSATSTEGSPVVLQNRFAVADTRAEKRKILDSLCFWPTPESFIALQTIATETWAQDRAMLNLTLRFGQRGARTWEGWLHWMSHQASLWEVEEADLFRILREQPQGLLLILYSQLPDANPVMLDALVRRVYESDKPIVAQALVVAWSQIVNTRERRALLGIPEPAAPPVITEYHPATAPPPIIAATPPEPAAPPVPPKPSFWETHLQPLFVENWYIVAGIAMVILGSSLLAYYTWDKHWLVRYTIMPALLAIFTWSLAGAGRWIEKKENEFKSTAAILRGAAIGLLPINFMAMALLSGDEKVPQKVPALLTMAAIYVSVFGLGLRHWCASVQPALKNRLAGALLLLNVLVAVGPLARTVFHLEGRPFLITLGAGFYVGFIVAAVALVQFTRKILTREMAEERRVPWFVASVLAVTYLQVFVWVHAFMRHLPQPHTYALLIIGIGWLILFAERGALELKQSPQLHGGESFLGFAFILLGLLMGFADPYIRIACFEVAGIVWLFQAFSRRHPLHYWIALTLFGLGGASVGLLEQFPGPWLPGLGILLALGYGLGASLSKNRNADLCEACRRMQAVALAIATIVAPLTQWHFRSEPWGTAIWLLVIAGIFAWRSFKDQKLHWLHATMVILALVLPYAGFMDMVNRTAHHNTMVFGLAVLSCLWLSVTRLSATKLVLEARSTVLWFYGSLAVAAMLLRVALGDIAPVPLWYRDFADYTGPILMMLVLIPATYYSRSLVPAGMAVAIMAVLFPELRANLHQTFPWLAWGSGFASSICALALTWLCFALRPWPRLQNLPEGDRFMGRDPFPLRRYDHTLFTWPIMAAALFLIIKVESWNFILNFIANGVRLKTAIALAITGVAWTFVGIYNRERRGAVVCIHLGWIWTFLGLNFGYRQLAENPNYSMPILAMGILLQCLYWFYRFYLEQKLPWVKNLLTRPMRHVLPVGSLALAVVCTVTLAGGAIFERIQWLYWFLLAQLAWHALATRNLVFGTVLFCQVWVGLLAVTAAGSGTLLDRVTIDQSLSPTVWLLIGIQIIFVALESLGKRRVGGCLVPPHPNPLPGGEEEELAGMESSESVAARPMLPSIWNSVSPLLSPPFAIASLLTFLIGLGGIADGVHSMELSRFQQFLVLATLLLTARAQLCGLMLLMAFLFGYVMVHRQLLTILEHQNLQLLLLASPWRVATLGLSMVLITQAGCWIHERRKGILTGPFAQKFFMAPSAGWIFWPATLLCATAACYHTFYPFLRERPLQLLTPYTGAVTFGLVAWFWRQNRFFLGTGCLLLLGNVHLVRIFGGEWLRGHGLSELHLVCLGMGLTLLDGSVLRRVLEYGWARKRGSYPRPQGEGQGEGEHDVRQRVDYGQAAIAAINRASLGLAASILFLLSANYFTAPNVGNISSMRFIVSGAMAWLAGWYFRRAARHPGPGEEAYIELCEGLYHFGVVMAIWCAALLVPWFREPYFTLIAVGLPVAYFYVRAEIATHNELLTSTLSSSDEEREKSWSTSSEPHKTGRAAQSSLSPSDGERARVRGSFETRRYRNSATVLGFIILALYVFKGAFHLILFPGTPVSTEYYHYNAPLIVVLGFALLRLHGLGGTSWLAFYGGIALMLGSYFWLTWLPGLSPFRHPMPSAWCATGLGHFWILLSYARSPLRTLIQRIARLDDDAWHSLRLNWGRCLLAATQTATFFGSGDYASNTYMVAPLLAGAATIFIHQGIIRMLQSAMEPLTHARAVGTRSTASPISPEESDAVERVPTAAERGRARRRGVAYLILGSLELLAALHMDFLIPSYLDKHYVIWAILGLWLTMLIAHQFLPRKPDFEIETIGRIALVFAALTLAHIFYHHAWSATGLWAMALGAILAAFTPVRTAAVSETSRSNVRSPIGINLFEQFCAALLLLIPAWLVYFSQVSVTDYGLTLESALQPWPILATTAAIFLTGLFARWLPQYWVQEYWWWRKVGAGEESKARENLGAAFPLTPALSLGERGIQFRLFDLTLFWLQTEIGPAARKGADFFPLPKGEGQGEGERDIRQTGVSGKAYERLQSVGAWIHHFVLWISLIICCTVQGAHYGAAFSGREIALLMLLEAALAVTWFYEGKRCQSMVAYYLIQVSAVACFAALRRHLMLTTTFWTYEYDVWASLAFSLILAGAKQVFDLQPRTLRVPLLTTMFLLPAMALVWVIVHGLGVNMALLVVGLHSVLFAYLGRESRESPYNILALSGFVAFILMVFYSKLHLRAVHAYIIPVGLGILVLQEIFRDRIKPDARNWIRLVTLMAMLGSSGYYALVDPRYPITFNLTIILLCLLGMGLGSFLRIRVYLAMSFAGLIVDLISILYKVLVQMERSARMTVIGSFVLAIGAVLVFGAIYYKTNKAKLDAWVEGWRLRLAGWQ